MPDDLAIDWAAGEDLDAIHRIERDSFPAPWQRAFFAAELEASGRFNIVARRRGAVIGYLFSMWLFDELHVNKIAVAAEERRRGVAGLLMERCFDFARAHGVRLITLEVRQSNRAAQEFYRRLAFASSYIRPRYYPDGEAAVVMMKSMDHGP